VRYTPKGSAVCDLGIAVNRQYTLENGEKREEVTYVDVVLWSRLAEIAGEYLKKGRPVFIEGRLQMDSWEDKQSGQKRTKLRVVGETMQLLGSRPGGGGSAPVEAGEGDQEAHAGRKSSPPPAKAAASSAPDDDEIPF
jgi:single-strand DNA-binding protein